MQKPTEKRITIGDVARNAGVAVGTVSRVMNNHDDVNSEVRKKVLKVATELNYRPLRRRRAQRGNSVRPGSMGLLILGMDEGLVHLPILGEFLHGVEAGMASRHHSLLFANIPKADRIPAFLMHNDLNGLIVKCSHYGEIPDLQRNALIKKIMKLPIVWILDRPVGLDGDICSFDAEIAARIVADHLDQRGHRRVAFLNPKKGKHTHERLRFNFEHACSLLGLSLTLLEERSESLTSWPEPSVEKPDVVSPLVQRWIALPEKERPTAIFVPADSIAIQVYSVLETLGMTVGKDVSIVSCNNEKPLVSGLKPNLATLDIQADRIGQRAVELLMWRLKQSASTGFERVLIEPKLVEGDSVAVL